MNRRGFLKLTAGAGASLCAGGSLKRSLGMATFSGNIPKGSAFEAATRR